MRFPEFTGEWERCKLGGIGYTFNGLTGKSGSDFGHGSPYITYKSIFDNSRVNIDRVEYVDISDIDRIKKTQNVVQYGDIFFTTSSETPEEVGMSSVLLDDVKECYLNSFCFGYRLTSLKVLPEYMRFYLRSQTIRKKMFVLAQGSTRFNISKSEVMGLTISIPTVKEQKRISKLLTLLEDRIETQKKIIEDLKKLKDAISRHLFNRKDLFECHIAISEIGTLKNGYAFQSSTYNHSGRNKIITISNVSGTRYINNIESCNCVADIPNDIQPHHILKKGDILISLTGNVGRVSLCIEGEYLLNQRVGLLKLDKGVDEEFVYQTLSCRRFEHCMIAHGQGAAQMNIANNDVECYRIPYSRHQSHMAAVASVLKICDSIVGIEDRNLRLFQQQKRFLLDEMFI